ncbi:hypothetical protein AJ80_08884 [Polytolypa hystricis UAMH7299]|uniref:Uncharacterized protein n=1 Tax=Polytolypa hystricis (strain UAMH7299) TaxID=1447883 RepID=A0A2B7X051_POLH7|nr:hypothetical protein AJ80_08884 [Polytolypa hystricis UAMH7299]
MILLLLLLVGLSNAETHCGVLGPAFPQPTNLSASKSWNERLSNFTKYIDNTLSLGHLNNQTDSFSLNVFSMHDDNNVIYDYHYEAPGLNGSLGPGKELNGDTIYRIGSISKLVSVYLFLIEAGFDALNERVIDHVPEIAAAVKSADSNNVAVPQWKDITIGALANVLTDFSTDALLRGTPGLPKVNGSQIPSCGLRGAQKPCNREQYFDLVLKRHPSNAPYSSPIYNNMNFDILMAALENMNDNATFEDMLSRSIAKPLNLTHFGIKKPDDSAGIIPGDAKSSYWNTSLGFGTANGGVYSSANDMAALGKAILGSKLLSPAVTRRWLKPTTNTADPNQSVGSPWEIYRLTEPRTIELFTKAGHLGLYDSSLILIPDYGVGFTILAAGEGTLDQGPWLSDLITGFLVPALEEEARQDALSKFAGKYVSASSNSTFVVSKKSDGKGGLLVDQWINNGVSVLDTTIVKPFASDLSKVGIRIYPTKLTASCSSDGGNKTCDKTSYASFRAIFDLPKPEVLPPPALSVFTAPCEKWSTVDGIPYGNIGLDDLVFHIDEKGVATALEVRAWRETLKRVV